MRYLNTLALMAVAVFLVGTNSTEVFAKRPSNPPELEQRVTDLEGQVADHETRIGDLETNDAIQDGQLGDQESRITILEEQAPPMPGIKVYDANDQFIGLLMGMFPHGLDSYGQIIGPHVTVFIPGLKKFISLMLGPEPLSSPLFRIDWIYFDGPNCTGNVYTLPMQNPDPHLLHYPLILDDGMDTPAPKYFSMGPYLPDVPYVSRMHYYREDCDPTTVTGGGHLLTEVNPGFTPPPALPLKFE